MFSLLKRRPTACPPTDCATTACPPPEPTSPFSPKRRASPCHQSAKPPEPDPNLWYINGKAYDLEAWLKRHPGGELILQQTKGTDVTALFQSYHTFTKGDAQTTLQKFYVRDARPVESRESADFEWGATPKFDELRARVRKHFAGRSPKAPPFMLAWHLMWTVLHVVLGIRWFMHGELATAIAFGATTWWCAGDWVHSGTHFAIWQSARLNYLMSYIFGTFHHIPSVWVRQHVIGHHTVTNLQGRDPDLYHFEVLSFFTHIGWRLEKCSPWKTPFRSWRLWALLAVPATGPGPMIVESIMFLLRGQLLSGWIVPQRSPLGRMERVLALLQWAGALATYVLAVHRHGVLLGLLPMWTHGTIYYLATQTTHCNKASTVDETDETSGGAMAEDIRRLKPRKWADTATKPIVKARRGEWVQHQFDTARGDYSWDSRLANFLVCGLNLQSVHHIFPNIHWIHYPELYPMICEVLGETPTKLTFADSMRNHLDHLSELNDDAAKSTHAKSKKNVWLVGEGEWSPIIMIAVAHIMSQKALLYADLPNVARALPWVALVAVLFTLLVMANPK